VSNKKNGVNLKQTIKNFNYKVVSPEGKVSKGNHTNYYHNIHNSNSKKDK
jgi:hypothetical protein